MPLFIIFVLFAGAQTIENNRLCVVDGPQTDAEVQYCEDLAKLGESNDFPIYTGPLYTAPFSIGQ